MPVHLAACDRRQFGGLLLGAGAAWLGELIGEETGERFVLLADTHIAADPDFMANGTSLAGNLRRVVSEILEAAKTEPISGVIIDGDCAFMSGEEGDYRTFGHLLEPLQTAGIPIHLTMGNHDDRDKMLAVMAERRPEFPPVHDKFVSIIESKSANWFLLDSLADAHQIAGSLGQAQLSWLSEVLASHPNKPAILVSHHHLETDPASPSATGLRDSEAFKKVLLAHRHIAAYIFGHGHDWRIRTLPNAGMHLVSLPPTAYVFQQGRPSGWVMASLSASGLNLSLHALNQTHPQHGESHVLGWL